MTGGQLISSFAISLGLFTFSSSFPGGVSGLSEVLCFFPLLERREEIVEPCSRMQWPEFDESAEPPEGSQG